MYCLVGQKRYSFYVTFVRPNDVPGNPRVRKEMPLQYKILCFFNYNVVYAVIFRCDFLLPLCYLFSFVACIFVFFFCSCAVSVIGFVTVVPAHKL
jgi:hypothetical protein